MITVHHLLHAQQTPRGRAGIARLTAFLGLPPSTPLHLVVRAMDPRRWERGARFQALVEKVGPLEVGVLASCAPPLK